MFTMYYSNKCAFCKALYSQLTSFPKVHKQFRFVEAETLSSRGVGMSVPTIIGNDRQVHVGTDAFRLIRSLTLPAPGLQSYDVSGAACSDLEYTDIERSSGGQTHRPRLFSAIEETGASAV